MQINKMNAFRKNIFAIFFLIYIIIENGFGYIVEPGPQVIATKGAIWPKPKQQTNTERYSVIRPSVLKFSTTNHDCDLLQNAFKRYGNIISSMIHTTARRENKHEDGPHIMVERIEWLDDPLFDGYLDEVIIDLKNECEPKPEWNMVENYQLSITNATGKIQSESVWGILRGLESFSQLLTVSADGLSLIANSTEIDDEPRFKYRGLLVDTSRHFMNKFTLKKILDGMMYNKLNVFHWHIVDDHSFPYQSTVFPELSAKGAYTSQMIYTQQDVAEIIEYAKERAIRTIAEFDTPGHTRSWGVAYPEILTECGGVYTGKLGPIDPIKNVTYEFMQKLLEEVSRVFPDEYIHLGGDEVGFECWESNKAITDYMKTNNISTYEGLEEKYIQRIVDMVKDLKHHSIVWQEVFVNGVRLAENTVVHIWTGNTASLLHAVTSKGYPAILSTCWYLDHLSTGGDWRKYYKCEPQDFPGDENQKKLVIGGEACMWSEVVDNSNVIQRIFPRASAAAERLWSPVTVTDVVDAAKRLEEHACRMRKRNLPAQPPNGPGYCV